MKKLVTGLAIFVAPISSAFAGFPVGFSTFQIDWAVSNPAAPPVPIPPAVVPTMGTYAIIVLAVLLAVVVFRVSRNRGSFIRAVAPLATFGIAASFALVSESPVAGIVIVPPIDGSSCNGSETYTADAPSPPPCFVNSCGSPVTVTYTLIEGETPDTTPITEETCTLAYFCSEGEGEGGGNPATDNSVIPSDGLAYGTAYCEEIFDGPPDEQPPEV